MRAGAATAAHAVGVADPKICHFGGWSILAGTYHIYIDPTQSPTDTCRRLFKWLVFR